MKGEGRAGHERGNIDSDKPINYLSTLRTVSIGYQTASTIETSKKCIHMAKAALGKQRKEKTHQWHLKSLFAFSKSFPIVMYLADLDVYMYTLYTGVCIQGHMDVLMPK